MPDWTAVPPRNFDIVTGFFPEARPKANWETNPRPLLVAGVFRAKKSGKVWVRVSYGTSKVEKIRWPNLIIGNMSHLDALNLACPTAFVITPGHQWAILPWGEEHFAPWSAFQTPVISRLPAEMRAHVEKVMKGLPDLPKPG